MQRLRILLSILACALLPGQAPAQDIQLITVAGQKQMLTEPGTDAVGGCRASSI